MIRRLQQPWWMVFVNVDLRAVVVALEGRMCGRSSCGTVHTCHQGGRVMVGRCVSEDRGVAENEVGMVDNVLVRSCIPLYVSLEWKTGTVETDRADEMERWRLSAASEVMLDGDLVASSLS